MSILCFDVTLEGEREGEKEGGRERERERQAGGGGGGGVLKRAHSCLLVRWLIRAADVK